MNRTTPRRALLGTLAITACGVGLLLASNDQRSPSSGLSPVVTAQPAAGGAPGNTDHTMFAGQINRNMINSAIQGLKFPTSSPREDDTLPPDQRKKKLAEDQKVWDGQWLKWRALPGSLAYGGPIISGGKVFVGTNNDRPRNKRDIKVTKDPDTGDVTMDPIDKGVLMCFDEKTGQFLWQAIHDKLPSGPVNDWPNEGICSTPTVVGEHVYYVTNRCTVVCADVNGFANGNQGITTEKYKDPTDVDIIWEYDMIKELDVFPHNMSACCPLIVGDTIYIVTANGVNEDHTNIPAPNAPSFLALSLDGKKKWAKGYPGRNIMHGQWSNPTWAEIGGVKQVLFPGGDGWLYSLNPENGEIIWKFDCNPKDAVYELGGGGTKSDFIGTPVIVNDRIYIGTGQDPEHTTGIAWFRCIAPAGKSGDVSPTLDTGMKDKDGKPIEKANPNSAQAWVFGGAEARKWREREFTFGRTMSTAAVVDDIVYIAELTGILHCLDAKTGKQYWEYDTKASIWGSAYYIDGKVLLGNDQGEVYIFKHSKTPETIDNLAFEAVDRKDAQAKLKAKKTEVESKYLLGRLEFDAPVRSTPVVANNTLYVMTEKTVHALKVK